MRRISNEDIIKCGICSEFNPMPFTYNEVWHRATHHYKISSDEFRNYVYHHPLTHYTQDSITLCKLMSHILKNRERKSGECSTSDCITSGMVTQDDTNRVTISALRLNAIHKYTERDVNIALRRSLSEEKLKKRKSKRKIYGNHV